VGLLYLETAEFLSVEELESTQRHQTGFSLFVFLTEYYQGD
jgi:hypothetical protein